MRIYNNFRYTETEEKRMTGLMLTFIPFKIFVLLYCGVGAGAGATGKIVRLGNTGYTIIKNTTYRLGKEKLTPRYST
jgi:hypothetical protein